MGVRSLEEGEEEVDHLQVGREEEVEAVGEVGHIQEGEEVEEVAVVLLCCLAKVEEEGEGVVVPRGLAGEEEEVEVVEDVQRALGLTELLDSVR